MQELIFKRVFCLVLGLFALPLFAHAEILINEIMYDLPGVDQSREWIEIYNSGPEEVTIITGGNNGAWRFSNGSQHTFALTKGSTTLSLGSHAVIVDNTLRFLADWPSFSGIILDSAVSLNNLLGELAIMSSKDGQVINKVTYYSTQGGSSDGSSLQRQDDGSWIPSLPTPGSKNSSVITIKNNEIARNSINLSPSAHYSAIPTSTNFPSRTLGLGAGRERIGVVGSPMEFKAETSLDDGKYTTFIWNFGDGSQGGGNILSHNYEYPGDYTVILNASFKEGNAISRINVKIIDPGLSITFANQERIEVRNNSPYEVNLFGRALVSGEKFFVFLKDTIIQGGQSLSFGSNITGLTPQGLYDAYIAVLGNKEHSQFRSAIEEQKLKQISYIKNQISILQQKIGDISVKQ